MEKFETFLDLPKGDIEMLSQQMLLEKQHQYTCSKQANLHKPSKFKKKKQYLCSEIKKGAIKGEMPVFYF